MTQPEQDPSSTDGKNIESGNSGIPGILRPLVKEVVKVGLVAYESVSGAASEVGKQFSQLLEEAKSEVEKSASPENGQVEREKTGVKSKGEKEKSHHRQHS